MRDTILFIAQISIISRTAFVPFSRFKAQPAIVLDEEGTKGGMNGPMNARKGKKTMGEVTRMTDKEKHARRELKGKVKGSELWRRIAVMTLNRRARLEV
jgi:hypothetical protein